MMAGGRIRAGVCVVIWVMVIAGAGAQADDDLPAPLRTLGGSRRFFSGPTNPLATTPFKTSPREFENIKRIGGRIVERPNGTRWLIKDHSYTVSDDAETRPTITRSNGHTGGALHAGEATQELPHPFLESLGESKGQQVGEVSTDPIGDESPDADLNGPGENKSPPTPEDASSDWSTDSDQWEYFDEEWIVVPLPNSAYSSLPAPSSSAAALVVIANEKVEVKRNVSGLANVSLHYRFYLSDNQAPDTPPELKVYQVVDGSHNLLQEDTNQGEWLERIIEVPEADFSSIVFEGWRKGDGNVIALSDVDITGVVWAEALDVGDDMTLTAVPRDNLPSTLTTEGNQTQDSPAPEEQTTDAKDQDNTATVSPVDTEVDSSLDSTANMSPSPAEGEVEGGSVTDMPVDPSDLEVLTDNPQNETRTSEQINDSTDIVALNSSLSSGDTVTLGDSDSGYSSSTTTTDGEESETDEEVPTTTAVTDDEITAPENIPEPVLVSGENTDNSTNLSILEVTPVPLQTNTSVTLPDGNTTVTSGPLINTEISENRNTSSGAPTGGAPTGEAPIGEAPTSTRLQEGQIASTNVSGGDELTSRTTLATPQSNATSGNVTSPSGVIISIEGTTPVSTGLLLPAANSTEAVTAVPVSSTSWQVFQVFLVLCVMGLLALGFLYWKKRRRQDDEIPVFTRHTDYHNPTFSMEDAANFMSRAGRNTYKTIE